MADGEYKVTVLKDGVPIFIGSTSDPTDLVNLWIEGNPPVRRVEIKATEAWAAAQDGGA